MNKQESDILKTIFENSYINQRILSETSGHSLGIVNKSLKALVDEGYLDDNLRITAKAEAEYTAKAPRNAIILAAGFGMRMVPINLTTPKAFLEVNGEPLIERLIKQLHEVGVRDITIVVGFMKESFDYLIDEYGVELVVNPEYAVKNNLSSLALAADRINNTYIIPSDIWCDCNPFNTHEMYSWYMVSDIVDNESDVRINRKMELVKVPNHDGGNSMIGIAYILKEDAYTIRENIKKTAENGLHEEDFWEISLYKGDRMIIPARVVHAYDVVEINTYEQLRELDGDSSHLKSKELDVIANVFKADQNDITDITVLKKGMTNRSFLFTVKNEKYIMRIPGEGTDMLINREEEAAVYNAIKGYGLCDEPVYINPKDGHKITKYLNDVRVCDVNSISDLNKCMKKLKQFHELHLKVDHEFDLFGQIDFYESLWDKQPSMFKDYKQTKANVISLRSFIESVRSEWCLTHIDAVPDNFLLYGTDDGEDLQLTDWEYSGMQDPHVDIAMFAIYSLFDKTQTDNLIDIYFDNNCDARTRAKIYCYMAVCGLLWSNWCEYKQKLGVEFGEYSLKQYRYAKDFFRYAMELINEVGAEQ